MVGVSGVGFQPALLSSAFTLDTESSVVSTRDGEGRTSISSAASAKAEQATVVSRVAEDFMVSPLGPSFLLLRAGVGGALVGLCTGRTGCCFPRSNRGIAGKNFR